MPAQKQPEPTGIAPGALPPEARARFTQAAQLLNDGRVDEAGLALRQLVDQFPGLAEAHFGLAAIANGKGMPGAAIEHLTIAIHVDPVNRNYLAALAKCQQAAQQHEAALKTYQKLLALNPSSFVLCHNIGVLNETLFRRDEAIRSYENALALKPDYLPSLSNLALAHMETGDYGRAVELLETVVAMDPQSEQNQVNLANAYLHDGQLDKALGRFDIACRLYFEQLPNPVPDQPLRVSRLIHDFEQLDYLRQQGLSDAVNDAYYELLKPIVARGEAVRQPGEDARIKLEPEEVKALAPYLNGISHRGDGSRVDGGALNPGLDVGQIEAEYNASFPEILVLDNVLTEEALDKLYRYCLESTIFKEEYGSGYLGALLARGFACPLLLQISEEIRTTFPNIFHEHRLAQAWAFKYDSTMTGIATHADFANVNMNFWISPDEGSLDKDGGGLIVWDKVSPRDWSFDDYNSNQEKMHQFLEAEGANAIRIPFRRNRAAIFNSTLFHRTDDIRFVDEYVLRRINVTFLFGRGLRL